MRPAIGLLLCSLWSANLHAQTTAEGVAAVEAGRLDEAVRILSAVVQSDPRWNAPPRWLPGTRKPGNCSDWRPHRAAIQKAP
jgi:hypothetical protein